ncbi:recombinase family protein [Caenispirillum bisanense]|uniref:recombinase family protein n=1 Tax=Caenispirillum bisanense TaxID=414052 RepID=UPI0039F6D715
MPRARKTGGPLRAAIYARYSSDLQSANSIDDQVAQCREYCARMGWTVVAEYADPATSGRGKVRPEYERMKAETDRNAYDVVVADTLARFDRQPSRLQAWYERLVFHGIKMHTIAQGEMDALKLSIFVGIAENYLDGLRHETRRGLRGKVTAGLSAGGRAYGYRLHPEIKGERIIHEEEAEVVRRVFEEYAAGASPRGIAAGLNADGIPGPRGGEWADTTIRGSAAKGTGLLNNALYVGRLVWDRCSYVVEPSTGARKPRPKDEAEWHATDVPHLRIVDDELWERVKARQAEVRTVMARDEHGNALNHARRSKHLLSGLLICGECGAPFIMVGGHYYGCNRARSKGTCTNSLKIRRERIEKQVMQTLRERLLSPETVAKAVDAMRGRLRRMEEEADGQKAKLVRKLQEVDAQQRRIADAIADGFYNAAMKDKNTALEEKRRQLQADLAELEGEAPPIPDATALAEGYRLIMDNLTTLLDGTEYPEGSSAWDLLHRSIKRITLTPKSDRSGLDAELEGSFAGIVGLVVADGAGHKDENSPEGSEECSTSVVAGAGFEPATFRL